METKEMKKDMELENKEVEAEVKEKTADAVVENESTEEVAEITEEVAEETVAEEAPAEEAVSEDPAKDAAIEEKSAEKPANFIDKCVSWFKEKTKNVKWKEVWDKVTTGLLILLMASPILILAYILLWFVLR